MVSSTAPTADEAQPAAAAPEWVVFSCEDRLFGVPLAIMREVVPPQPLTRLPGCGPEVAGLMGLRGRVITVFDMGVILGVRSALQYPDYRLLVLDHGNRITAIAVDAVGAIARGDAAVLQPPDPANLPAAVRDDAVGIGTLEDRSYIAIDTNRILGRLLTEKETNA